MYKRGHKSAHPLHTSRTCARWGHQAPRPTAAPVFSPLILLTFSWLFRSIQLNSVVQQVFGAVGAMAGHHHLNIGVGLLHLFNRVGPLRHLGVSQVTLARAQRTNHTTTKQNRLAGEIAHHIVWGVTFSVIVHRCQRAAYWQTQGVMEGVLGHGEIIFLGKCKRFNMGVRRYAMVVKCLQPTQAVVMEMRGHNGFDGTSQRALYPLDQFFRARIIHRGVENNRFAAVPHNQAVAGNQAKVIRLLVRNMLKGVGR